MNLDSREHTPEPAALSPLGPLDRESLRAELRVWSDHMRRLALERVVEQLSDADLARLFDQLARLDRHDAEPGVRPPRLQPVRERIRELATATRRGEFRGEISLRHPHGDRAPAITADWLAATTHLLDVALERARSRADEDGLAGLRELVEIVEEVDQRPDELVVFEDADSPVWLLGGALGEARTLLHRES